MSMQSTSSTPKGTLPQPVRLSTKHKRVEYGVFLMAKHAEKHKRKVAAQQKKQAETFASQRVK